MDEPLIPWARVASFVRQHTHDVRNHLNSLDLEASLLSELVTTDEAKATVERVRRQIRNFANEMRALSSKFSEPVQGKALVPASMMFLIWQDQADSLDPKPQVEWSQDVGEAKITVDPDAIARVFRELLTNATQFSRGKPLTAAATRTDGQVDFTLREPKEESLDPSAWGEVPLTSTRRGGYGLGLWNLSRSVEASHGTVNRTFDSGKRQLVTTLSFPAQ